MISLLLISSNQSTIDNYIQNLCKKEDIDPIDLNIISAEKNIGIGDVREIIKKIFFKPLKSLQKMVIIKKMETATLEAQNSLLKILEEPPADTNIILCSSTKEQLLPTILSRCKIITFNNPEETKGTKETKETNVQMTQLEEMSIGEKLKLAQDLAKNKEEAIEYLTELIHNSRESMLTGESGTEVIKILLATYKMATMTNINLRFLLEHSFVSIP